MAWPPAVPPATRTNTTPQVDNHPADHNGISAALTELVNHVSVLDTTVLYRYFATIAQRDAFWPVPPPGASCTIPFINANHLGPPLPGQRRMDFVFDDGAWWPRGVAVQASLSGSQTVGSDGTFFGIAYDTTSIVITDVFNRTNGVWTAPFSGLVKVTAGILVTVATAGDYNFALGLARNGTIISQFANVLGRMTQHDMNGSMVVLITAGQTLQVQGLISGATGLAKTFIGGASNNNGFLVEYI